MRNSTGNKWNVYSFILPPSAFILSLAAYAGMFVFGIVMALLGAVLPLLSQRIGFDLAQAGNLFFAMNLAMLASTSALGPVMDRFGKRPPLAVGSLFVALALLLVAAAMSYRTLLVGVFLLGLGGGALNGATNTLVADLYTDPRRKGSALSRLGAVFGFGALFLPFVTGSLLKALGLNMILYCAAGLTLATLALFLALAFPPPKHAQGLPLTEAMRLARNPRVLLFAFLLFFQSGSEFIIGGYTSTYLTEYLKSSISAAMYLLAAYWAAMIAGRAVSSRLLLYVKGPTLVLLSALGSALGIALLLLAATEQVAALGTVLIGLSFASIFPTVLGLASSRFEAYSGTVFGILFTIALVGGMTLPWAVGHIAEGHGLRAALTLVAVNAGMVFVLQLLISRFSRETT